MAWSAWAEAGPWVIWLASNWRSSRRMVMVFISGTSGFIGIIPRIDWAIVSRAPERSTEAAGEGKPGQIREWLIGEFRKPPVAVMYPGVWVVSWIGSGLVPVAVLKRVRLGGSGRCWRSGERWRTR